MGAVERSVVITAVSAIACVIGVTLMSGAVLLTAATRHQRKRRLQRALARALMGCGLLLATAGAVSMALLSWR